LDYAYYKVSTSVDICVLNINDFTTTNNNTTTILILLNLYSDIMPLGGYRGRAICKCLLGSSECKLAANL